MLFFKSGFVRLGSVLHIFLDHRKSQKISNKLKKSKHLKKISKYLKFAGKKQKNKKKQVALLRVIPHHDISKQLVDTTFV